MVAKTGAFSTSNGSFPNLLTIPCLFAPSVNSDTVASAPLVVNGCVTKVPLLATGTGKNFDLSYNTNEGFPVLYVTVGITLVLLPFNVFNASGKLSIA